MSKIPHPTEPASVRHRRKPGLAARTTRTGSRARHASPSEGQYEEHPQQQPATSSERLCTTLPSRRRHLLDAHIWLDRLARNPVAATLITGLLGLCAIGAIGMVTRGTNYQGNRRLAPLATRATATPSVSTRLKRRHATLPPHRRSLRRKRSYSPVRAAYMHTPAKSARRPRQAVPDASAPAVQAAPSQPADSPPPEVSGEGQTQGGLFSP
jgi:hypothetical protein